MTFAQAEGRAALPSQLALGEISPLLRAKLWQAVHDGMIATAGWSHSHNAKILGDSWTRIMKSWYVERLHLMADKFRPELALQSEVAKDNITSRDYVVVLDFVEFLLKHEDLQFTTKSAIVRSFKESLSSYRVVDLCIVPLASEAEGSAILTALSDLKTANFTGAHAHMMKAGELLTRGDFASSIRESIHAVESVATLLEPGSNTLGPALKKLELKGTINPNLKRGFNALYDYTSDEKGIRHALLDAGANVDESDALYMFGACASFVTYLVRKAAK